LTKKIYRCICKKCRHHFNSARSDHCPKCGGDYVKFDVSYITKGEVLKAGFCGPGRAEQHFRFMDRETGEYRGKARLAMVLSDVMAQVERGKISVSDAEWYIHYLLIRAFREGRAMERDMTVDK